MKSKLINDGPQKTYLLVLDKGDEAVSRIEGFARENRIAAPTSLASARSATRYWASSIGRRRTTGKSR